MVAKVASTRGVAASTPVVEATKDMAATRDVVASRDVGDTKVGASLRHVADRTRVVSVAAMGTEQLEAFKVMPPILVWEVVGTLFKGRLAARLV
jgi:hypothetical protein